MVIPHLLGTPTATAGSNEDVGYENVEAVSELGEAEYIEYVKDAGPMLRFCGATGNARWFGMPMSSTHSCSNGTGRIRRKAFA